MSFDQARLARLAASYIDHILLILESDNGGANLRDFLDPWWSLSRGAPFVRQTRGGYYAQHILNYPCPWEHRERLPKVDWVSAEAADALRRCVRKKTRTDGDLANALIVDHAVPLAVIREELFSRRSHWTKDSLTAFLAVHYRRGLLTKKQDALLNEKRDSLSLKSKMPMGWKVGDDPYARYHARGILQADLALVA